MDVRSVRVVVPKNLRFTSHGAAEFSSALRLFDWTLKDIPVTIDFTRGKKANFQALSLIVLYAWYLSNRGCEVRFEGNPYIQGSYEMWRRMGATQLFYVSENPSENFRNGKMFAIRNQTDFRNALMKAETFTKGFDVEYEKTLRYVLSELLYNTLEHGRNPSIPSLIQFGWYSGKRELSFIVADLGVGILRHLRQAYPELAEDVPAILHALKPQVSGTFFRNTPYSTKDNAGVGLYLSSNIIRRLHAEMHVVSGNGVVHISPTDVTGRKMEVGWPGTFIYVTIKLGESRGLNLQRMMADFRDAAQAELSAASVKEESERYYVNINNYFGIFAEDKMAAIKFRDKRLLPEVASGKTILLDFDDVRSAPHSFLSALLAGPIREFGMQAYKKIKVVNAAPEIRETIDFILDENTRA